MPPTHFLCLPLITPTSRPQLERSLAHLRETTKRGDCKIPESAHRPLGVLHLTLGVMSLNPERLESALKLLRDIDLDALLTWAGDRPKTKVSSGTKPSNASSTEINSTGTATTPQPGLPQTLNRPISPPPSSNPNSSNPNSSNPNSSNPNSSNPNSSNPNSSNPNSSNPNSSSPPLSISLTGLSAFPDARKATVLHAQPQDPTNRLYYFCLALRQNFLDAGFIAVEDRPLVLHATLVNTVYSKSDKERKGESGRGMGKLSIDARELMRSLNGREAREDEKVSREAVGRFVWAEGVVISGVRICKMGAKVVEDQGMGMEYEVVGEKNFGSREDCWR